MSHELSEEEAMAGFLQVRKNATLSTHILNHVFLSLSHRIWKRFQRRHREQVLLRAILKTNRWVHFVRCSNVNSRFIILFFMISQGELKNMNSEEVMQAFKDQSLAVNRDHDGRHD